MGNTINLYKISLDGQNDVIAFLGEQDAQTFSQILFTGYDQYMIMESETAIEDIKDEYPYTICNDSDSVPFNIVFIRDKKIRNIFTLTLMFAMAGLSIESFDLAESRKRLGLLDTELDNLNTNEIPLSYIQRQASSLKSASIAQ